MATPPPDPKLRAAPFAVHATRGIIRDRKTRRVAIFVLLALAVLMVIVGSTFLREFLNPRAHVGWFAVYWLACGWFTFTAMLLALFDLLIVRAEARQARRILREEAARSTPEE